MTGLINLKIFFVWKFSSNFSNFTAIRPATVTENLSSPQRYDTMGLKAIWANNTPYSKFLISVGIILLSAVFFTLLGTFLASIFYGVDMAQLAVLMSNLENPSNIEVLKMVQTVSAIGTFIVPPFILAWLFDPSPLEFLTIKRKPLASAIPNGSLPYFLLLCLSSIT